MSQTSPVTESAPLAWRYEIQHGPDGETDYAWVYDLGNNLVCTTKTRHAIAIVDAMRGHAQNPLEPKIPTRSDIGVLIRDSMGKEEGWLQYLPAADAILNYWTILNKTTVMDTSTDRRGQMSTIDAVAKLCGLPRCVPPNPEHEGYHWIRRFRGGPAIPLHWNPTWWHNADRGWGCWGQPDRESQWEYLGPCPSPDDVPVTSPDRNSK